MSEDEQRPERAQGADRTPHGDPGGSASASAASADGASHKRGTSQGRDAAEGEAPSWGAHNAPPHAAKGRQLRRSRTHKIAGGVCGGLGRYFDLDPVLFRVPLVVLSVVGGFGLIFYGFAWLLIPAEGETQNEGRRLLSGRVEGASLSAILVALVGCGLFLASLGSRSVPFSVLLIGAVAGAAYWSQHRKRAEAAGAQVDPTTAHAVADAPPEAQAPPVPAPASWWREPLTKDGGQADPVHGSPWGRAGAATGYLWGPHEALPYAAPPSAHERPWTPPSAYAGPQGPQAGRPPARPGGAGTPAASGSGSLGGLTFLAALLVGGTTAAVSWDTRPLATTLVIGLSCALAVFGLGLGVSAFVGRMGPGTLFCLVLTAGLLAGAAALPRDISAHFRETHWAPAGVQEVKPRYALGSGSGELDLRETRLKGGQRVRSEVRVGAGQLKVVVPEDAVVEVKADVGAGATRFPRSVDGDGEAVFDSSGGLGTTRSMTLRPFDGADPAGTVRLDLSVGLGSVEVVRELPSGERSDRQGGPSGGAATDPAAPTPGSSAPPPSAPSPPHEQTEREGTTR